MIPRAQAEHDEYIRKYCIGQLRVVRIVFRTQEEILPFIQALEAYARKHSRPRSGTPAVCAQNLWYRGVPIIVDPELQGPSPKIVKTLA